MNVISMCGTETTGCFFFAGICDDCMLQYMNVQCVYAGAAVVYLYKCLGVRSFVPVADMSTLVKSQKLQAIAFFEKESLNFTISGCI